MTIGEEIKRLADLKGFETQQDIAAAAGLSQSFVARLLKNERPNLTADVLYRLCDALGVGCDHFRPYLTESPPPPAQPTRKPRRKPKS